MNTIIEAEAFCLSCEKTQPHRLMYVGSPKRGEIYLKKAICLKCGNVLLKDRLEILESYLAKGIRRVLTKPFDLLGEIQEKPFTFPYLVAKEIFEIVNKE